MNVIPEVALRTIEDIFGTRFVRHADGEADAGQLFASVFPENAAQLESLTKLAARYRIPLIARGAGTALNSGRTRALRRLPGGESVLDRACS
jgi:FAD/FMN-containing dehydrogenase